MTQGWLVTLLVAGGAFAVATLAYALWVLRDVAAMRRDDDLMTPEVTALIQRGEEGLRALLNEAQQLGSQSR